MRAAAAGKAAAAVAGVPLAGGFSFALAWGLSWSVERLFPPELLGPSAAEGVFDGSRAPAQVAWLALVAAPLYETLFAPGAPMEIAHRLRLPLAWGLVAGAAVFGLAHAIGGGPGHGFVMLAVGLVFAGVYAAYRSAGMLVAYFAAAGAHLVHNALSLALVHR
ncbi:MAG TPA: hypothetical protein VFR90_14695 [Methylibium sp.]|uniref:hypothetical protein n=1 Tax=Methylibium sp. TaxID=2067992 RepID=UPI002DB92129|nr:hypothetical protein [Methylibium sp.]HEU4460366.1 hypothetical protein [Methylibium sp.]